MKCAHCLVHYHDNWIPQRLMRHGEPTGWVASTAICPNCKEFMIEVTDRGGGGPGIVYPLGTVRGPVPKEVPEPIASDYREAVTVLSASPKASAALSRRCLQSVLRSNGYASKDLAKEIDLLLSEPDPKKAIPGNLRDAIDAIRNFGNFSAHPINDVTQLQIIEVEPHEAEWCLDILDEMFQHFYVRPAETAARKAALNAKLAAAGKPPAK